MNIEKYMQCPLHIIVHAFNNFLIFAITIYRRGETFDMRYRDRLNICLFIKYAHVCISTYIRSLFKLYLYTIYITYPTYTYQHTACTILFTWSLSEHHLKMFREESSNEDYAPYTVYITYPLYIICIVSEASFFLYNDRRSKTVRIMCIMYIYLKCPVSKIYY